jgi:YD repeat-containing protein
MLSIGITLNPAVIAAGASLSGPVSLGALTLVGISMPAVWTAAGLTFQITPDGTTWQELYDGAGNEVTITVAAGLFIIPLAIPSYLWRGINMLQVRSGTLGSPVNQVAAATINIITRSEML